MAYTTCNTVNNQRRNKPIEVDQIVQEKHKNFSSQAYSFLEVKLQRVRRKTKEGKYDTRDKNLPSVAVLANASSSNIESK